MKINKNQQRNPGKMNLHEGKPKNDRFFHKRDFKPKNGSGNGPFKPFKRFDKNNPPGPRGGKPFTNNQPRNGGQEDHNRNKAQNVAPTNVPFRRVGENNQTGPGKGKPFNKNQRGRSGNTDGNWAKNKNVAHSGASTNQKPQYHQRNQQRKQRNQQKHQKQNQQRQHQQLNQKDQQRNLSNQQQNQNLDTLFTAKPAKLDYCLAPERLDAQARALKRFEQQEQEANQQQRRSEKERRHKLMTAKTRKGQPVMQGRMELLYEQVQKMVAK
ncbi:GATA zinc finger domain-containing protein 10-like [Topomyia yanbarensis]|uniref:GATA zinc finger domain-containing protein 10-like n=1 Tax=Topomyia yanbarensis TaxID=2498891 RepID=UPI00273B043A|nr:GATA zinc finger domain-containing protein 10-like [Topomyia yanbarensis]